MTATTIKRKTPADEAAIRALESAYDAAWNAGDAAAAARLFVPDAVVVNPSGGISLGRDAVEQSLQELFAGRGRGSQHISHLLAIYFVTNDVAVLDGEAVIIGFGAGPSPLRHRFTDVLVRHEGAWRIAQVRAYQFMLLPDADTQIGDS